MFSVSASSVGRALSRLGLTRKKSLSAIEKERPDVKKRHQEFLEEVAEIDPKQLVFADESGTHIAMTRACARAPEGERIVGRVPRSRGVVTTVLGAIGAAGVAALMTIEGATTGEVFTAFARDVLAPTLRRGQVVALDNLGAHKVKAAREAIEARGARLLFQPPYAPEVNPLENAWAFMKDVIRSLEPRSIEALDDAVVAGARQITPRHARNFFGHCGYQFNR